MYLKKLIEAYKTAAKHIVKAKGLMPGWPFPIISSEWFHGEFFVKEVYDILKKLRKRGISDKEIAELFWGPSAIAHWLYIPAASISKVWQKPFKGLSTQETIEFMDETIKLMSLQRKGYVFCQDGKNILWSTADISRMLSTLEFAETYGKSEKTRILSAINTIIWHYCILIQVGHRSYSHEFHGPYNLRNGEQLLIRDYFNLKPVEVWEFSSLMPFDKLRIIEKYHKNTKIYIDNFNHYSISAPNPQFAKPLGIAILLECTGKSLHEEHIQQLFNSCNKALQEGNAVIGKFSKRDWVKKLIQMRYYWLKPSMEALNKKWQPPSEVYSLINRIEEAEESVIQHMKVVERVIASFSEDEAAEELAKILLDIVYSPESKGGISNDYQL